MAARPQRFTTFEARMLLGGIDWRTFITWRAQAGIEVADQDVTDRRRKLYTRAQVQQIADQHHVELREEAIALASVRTPGLKGLIAAVEELTDANRQLHADVQQMLTLITPSSAVLASARRRALVEGVRSLPAASGETHSHSHDQWDRWSRPQLTRSDDGANDGANRTIQPLPGEQGEHGEHGEHADGTNVGRPSAHSAESAANGVDRVTAPGIDTLSPFQWSSALGGVTQRRPAGGPKTRPLATAPDPRDLRTYWVGRGDVIGYFALFIYCQQAHGIKESTAGTQAVTVKKRLLEGREPVFALSSIELARGEERRVVTREQAIKNIRLLQEQAKDRFASREVPERARCVDSECPVCPALNTPA